MAICINQDCISCGACEPECPNQAISQGDDIFVIDPERCTECVGFFDEEQCVAVCPAEACIPDPDHQESEADLIARAQQLWPERDFGTTYPSKFRS